MSVLGNEVYGGVSGQLFECGEGGGACAFGVNEEMDGGEYVDWQKPGEGVE
jgi:hypothetical protein